MPYIHSNDSNASIISLILACLSIVACLSVILSVLLYPKAKESFHLQLVNRLLLSDLGLSCCVVFYFIIQFGIDTPQLKQFCKVYYPTLLYFFISSFWCTTILSSRFRTLNDSSAQKKVWTPPIKLNYIFLFPLLSAFPVLIGAWATGAVTTVHVNSQDTNQVCSFNHDTIIGMALDLIFFQFPLFCTIVINGYFYTKGVLALRNSPQSVIARQMNRAGGYMLVLLVVWVPNIFYNMVTIFAGTNDSYLALLDLCVFLTSAQGMFDVAVYVWSNQKLRKWLYKNLVFFRLIDLCCNYPRPNQQMGSNSPKPPSGPQNATNGDERDSDDEDDWLQTSLSFSGQSPSDVASVVSHNTSNTKNSHNSMNSKNSNSVLDVEGQVENPINAKSIRNIDKVIPKTKSILVGGAGNSSVASSFEIDSEKFVRFGENSTRFISTSTTGRSSEIAMTTRIGASSIEEANEAEEQDFFAPEEHDSAQLFDAKNYANDVSKSSYNFTKTSNSPYRGT
jgi:hypothetical protein